jgi:glutamyl-tRNA reductase
MCEPGVRSDAWLFSGPDISRSAMNDFNRKVEETSARVNKSVAEAAERIEKETADFVAYLNNEVVPAVRQHSTKALRVAAEKMKQLADYLDQAQTRRK